MTSSRTACIIGSPRNQFPVICEQLAASCYLFDRDRLQMTADYSELQTRTFPAAEKRIRQLRMREGWNLEQLAKKANVSLTTIERLEKGGRAYLATFNLVASAFNVPADCLVDGYVTDKHFKEILSRPRRGTWPDKAYHDNRGFLYTIEIDIDANYDLLDQTTEMESLIQRLKDAAKMTGAIRVRSIGRRSIAIQMAVIRSDAAALLVALCNGSLESLNVYAYRIYGDNEAADTLSKVLTKELGEPVTKADVIDRLENSDYELGHARDHKVTLSVQRKGEAIRFMVDAVHQEI